ncbi:hypothetical protein, partial [Luteimonas sp. SDU101]
EPAAAAALVVEQAPPADDRAPGLFDAPVQAPPAQAVANSPAEDAAEAIDEAAGQDDIHADGDTRRNA